MAAETGQAMCLLANPDALPAVHRMCQNYPRTRVVIDHFARIGMSGEIVAADLDNLCRLAKFENVFVKTSAFYALGAKKPPYTDLVPMIKRLIKEYGADRLMWASDCPYQVQGEHTYAASIDLIRRHVPDLSTKQRDDLLRDTAKRVFFS
jgi:predicted TIM-barrel fold metal-dependent hydrolase